MKKQGVKRGSKQHRQYISALSTLEEEKEHRYWWRSRQYVLDCVVIALGQLFEDEMEREDFRELIHRFSELYIEIEREIAFEVGREADEEAMNRDKIGSIWASTSKLDRMIQQYVLPEDFSPYEERYDEYKAQPMTMKDEVIMSLKRVIDKKDDEITKLKSQMKLMKIAKENRND